MSPFFAWDNPSFFSSDAHLLPDPQSPKQEIEYKYEDIYQPTKEKIMGPRGGLKTEYNRSQVEESKSIVPPQVSTYMTPHAKMPRPPDVHRSMPINNSEGCISSLDKEVQSIHKSGESEINSTLNSFFCPRKRINSKKVEKGNNSTGRKGKMRCSRCRKRHSEVLPLDLEDGLLRLNSAFTRL